MSSSILKFVAKQGRTAGSAGTATRATAARALTGKGLPGRGHGATRSFTSTPAALKSVLVDSVELPNAAETIGAFAAEGRPLPNWAYLRNGDKDANTIFSPLEMEDRLGKLRAHMSDAGLDAVLLTSIHNVNYFSGFVYCSFGRPYGLLVTHDDSLTIAANIDYSQPWRRSHGDAVIYTDWQKDNFYKLASSLLVDEGVRRLGVEDDHMTMAARTKLTSAIEAATGVGAPTFNAAIELKDVADATMQIRMVKSVEEIALITAGANVADVGGAAAKAAIEAAGPGIREYEVALASTTAMVHEIAARYPGADLMDTWTWFQSGINTDGAHNPVTDRALCRGDVLSLNAFPMIGGYYTALERTFILGEPTAEQLRVWEANVAVHERGLELIKPGARCSEIAQELNEIFAEKDLLHFRTFGYGHSFGTLSHYYGREAGLELREDVDTVIQPGHVVSMEPMLTIPVGVPGLESAAGGYREHDILVVNETGATNITGFGYGPEANTILA